MILSTGMSNMDEVLASVKYILDNGCKDLVVLHCVSNYPTNLKDLNLLTIKTMKEKLSLHDIKIGFSDHTEGIEASIYAVCVGAKYIEKHFTIDKNMEGPDHKASLNPQELNLFIRKIREAEIMLGDGVKKFRTSETENRKIVRRSLAYNIPVKKGTKIEYHHLTTLRPNTYICGTRFEEFIGNTLNIDVLENDFLKLEHF